MESTKTPVRTWREKRAEIVVTEHVNGSQDGGDGDEAESEEEDVGIVVFGDGNWVCSVVVVILGCSSEANAVESAVDIVF